MGVVEDVMVLGSDHPLRSIVRDEGLLLSPPHPPKVPVKLWQEHPPLTVVHYPQQYEPEAFALRAVSTRTTRSASSGRS